MGKVTGDFDIPVTISSGRGPGTLAAADFDNDNKMDFVVGHQFSCHYFMEPLSLPEIFR